jgi:hypothetical protein
MARLRATTAVCEVVALELHHVGGREVARDQDEAALGLGLRRHARLPGERLHDPLRHLDHVVTAFAQILVLDLVELGEQGVGLRLERPFGVASLGLDDAPRRDRQHGIVEDHQVEVDERRELGGGPGRHRGVQLLELRAHPVHGRVEARRFLARLPAGHAVARHLQPGMRHQLRMPDGDAAGDADAVEGEAHRAIALRVPGSKSPVPVQDPEP